MDRLLCNALSLLKFLRKVKKDYLEVKEYAFNWSLLVLMHYLKYAAKSFFLMRQVKLFSISLL